MPTELYLDTARLGRMALVARQTAADFARLTSDEVALIRRTGKNIRSAVGAAFGTDLSPATQQPEGTP